MIHSAHRLRCLGPLAILGAAAGFLVIMMNPRAGVAFELGHANAAPGDTLRAPAGSLEAVSLAFTEVLSEVSGEGLAALLAAGSIRLHLDGPRHAGLSSRQAAASLRSFLREFDSGEAWVLRAAPVEGAPDRGFAEIMWSTRVAGTSQEIRRTVFLGLTHSEDEWRVDEVRLIR